MILLEFRSKRSGSIISLLLLAIVAILFNESRAQLQSDSHVRRYYYTRNVPTTKTATDDQQQGPSIDEMPSSTSSSLDRVGQASTSSSSSLTTNNNSNTTATNTKLNSNNQNNNNNQNSKNSNNNKTGNEHQSLPKAINSTMGPHLVMSGHLVQPMSSLFRLASNASTHMRMPSYYYSSPLFLNRTIPIPQSSTQWRTAVLPQTQPTMTFSNQTQFSPANFTSFNASNQNLNKTDNNQSKPQTAPMAIKPVNVNEEDKTGNLTENADEAAHRSLFSDLGLSLFSGKGKGKLLKEDLDEDEYDEKPKKLSKLGGKKDEVKKLGKLKPLKQPVAEYPSGDYSPAAEYGAPAAGYPGTAGYGAAPPALGLPLKTLTAAPALYPMPATGYKSKIDSYGDDDYAPEPVKVKPIKGKLGGKLTGKLLGKEKEKLAPAPEYDEYAAPSALYSMDGHPKGKFIPQYRSNVTNPVVTNGVVTDHSEITSELRSVPTYYGVRSPYHKTIKSANTTTVNTNSTTNANSTEVLDDRMKVFKSSVMKTNPTMNLNAHSDNYGSKIFELNFDDSSSRSYPPGLSAASAYAAAAAAAYPPQATAAAYPPPAAAAAYPPPAAAAAAYPPPAAVAAAYPPPAAAAAYPPPAAAAAYPPPAAAAAYPSPAAAAAYPPPAALAAYPPPAAAAAYPPPAALAAAYPPPAAAAYPPPTYSNILNKVLASYPSKLYPPPPSGYASNKYDYSMPVAVVNLFCSNPKYPCSCTLYLTEINGNNMLISGVCSGLKKDKYYLLNLYSSGDITAGCDTLDQLYNLGGSYSKSNLLDNLGIIKSDYHGVAFVNKLKRGSLSVMCDKYGYKASILGRAVGLTEVALPLPLSAGYGALPLAAKEAYPLPAAAAYRSIPYQPPLVIPKVSACGVIGLANKDNSYETRELKSKLVANAEIQEKLERSSQSPK